MKRILTTILTILYFASNTGATIHMHYCMGKLVEKNLVHNDDKQCSNCGMDRNEKEDNGCCKDEHKKIQIDQQQQVVDASVFALQFSSTAILPQVFYDLPTLHLSSVTEDFPKSKAPPDIRKAPLFKLHCVYRI